MVSYGEMPDKIPTHNSGLTFVLGVLQMKLSLVLFCLGLAATIINTVPAASHHLLAQAILGVVTGGFSMWTGNTKRTCHILTTMVLSVMYAAMVAPTALTYGITMITAKDGLKDLRGQVPETPYGEEPEGMIKGAATVGLVIAIIGVVQIPLTVGIAVATCKGTCCKTKEQYYEEASPLPIKADIPVGVMVSGDKLVFTYDQA